MRIRDGLIAMALGLAVMTATTAWAAIEILKEEPAKNALPRGKIVYVDDGTCPPGEIKEITGGNQDKGLPRQVRCVKRPS